METIRFGSPEELLRVAGAYLEEREAEHNLILGIVLTLRDQPGFYREPPYLAAVLDQRRVALVAIRTPPFGVVLSEPSLSGERRLAAIEALGISMDKVCADLLKEGVASFAKSFADLLGAVEARRREIPAVR